ncbi:GyrI-like domain-containing protein [Candidatus Gracilibacteria bacterium]|nr:GyrI-like domain-containing protein [Candidatus Gracilibacteria bacterium]
MKKLSFVFGILVFLSLGAFYLGLFQKIDIAQGETGSYTVVYDTLRGKYNGVGPIMDNIYEDLKADGIETTRGFGIYLDNPEIVEADQLRSIAGSVIEEKDLEKLNALGEKYKILEIESGNMITTEFPFKGKMSVFASLMKVYPAIMKKLEAEHMETTAIMELYDIPNKKMYFFIETDGETFAKTVAPLFE